MSFCVLSFGWRFSFMLLGLAGILWAAAWFWWFRDRPLSTPYASVAEMTSAEPGNAARWSGCGRS